MKYRKSSGFLNYPSLYQRIARKILTGSGCLKTAGRMAGYCLMAHAQCRLMGGRIPRMMGACALRQGDFCAGPVYSEGHWPAK